MNILFYISGHGYGHGARMAEVIRAVLAAAPSSVRIYVRTSAPSFLFPSDAERLCVETVAIDSKIHETADSLNIDIPATLRDLELSLAARDEIVRRETSYVRAKGIRLIVADIPFVAGNIAQATGIPSIAIGNFTWNWILSPYMNGNREVLRAIEGGYRPMRALLKLPFSHSDELDMFDKIEPVPLIATPRARTKPEARALLGLEPAGRPVVFVSFRGQIPDTTFRAAAAQCPDFIFLTADPARTVGLENARSVDVASSASFQLVADASDVIVAKLGYGMAAGCSAGKIRMLYPPRSGFREEPVMEAELRQNTCIERIPIPEFYAGDWQQHLTALLSAPMPPAPVKANGAEVCARRIVDLLAG